MSVKQICFLLIVLMGAPITAQGKIVLASGAGYRSFVEDLADAYTAETGKEIERVYGNMARIIAQARSSSAVDLLLGDASFLKKSQLPFISTTEVGKGRLVAAFPKGGSFTNESDLLSPQVTRIAIPDTSRAIYGKAAMEYLQNKDVYTQVKSKLLIVATVPQAASYVVAKEVDFSLINLTHAKKIEKSIGGYTLIDETAYSPITIIIGQLKNAAGTNESSDFIAFLQSEKVQEIRVHHGM